MSVIRHSMDALPPSHGCTAHASSHGHSTIGELLLDSMAHRVTMTADIPVMLVPIDR